MGLSWGWLRGVFAGLRTNRRKARSHRVTGLEDRTLLAAFVVNTLLDTVDANPGDGLALDADGNTSLRAAVMEANALAGADTITLGEGVYQLSLPGDEAFSMSGDLDITSQITIEGVGAALTTIDANLLDRVFDVTELGGLTLRGVTVTRGLATDGGAIRNRGKLNIENSALTGNRATRRGGAIESYQDALQSFGAPLVTFANVVFSSNVAQAVTTGTIGSGGAIYFESSMATITNCTFMNNMAAVDGGAIYALQSIAGSSITINTSTFSSNNASNGGAIRLTGVSTTNTINDSLFTGNRAVLSGGAIRTGGANLTINRGDFEDNRTTSMTDWNSSLAGGAIAAISGGATIVDGTEFRNNASWAGGAVYAFSAGLTVRNSLFEGNTARPDTIQGRGGAVFASSNAVVNVINSTLVGNSSYMGGALCSVGASARWTNNTVTGNTTTMIGDFDVLTPGAVYGGTLLNSIVAGNVNDHDVGNVSSLGGNVIGFSYYGFASTNDLYGNSRTGAINPYLLPLAENGGPTRTMALSASSPARDRGLSISPAPTTDARGVSRSGSALDAGAYEYQNRGVSARPYSGQTPEDTILVDSVTATDADGDPLTFEFSPIPQQTGTITGLLNGQFRFTPAPNFNGLVRFFYRVSDGHGSTSAWIQSEINVTPVNDPPIIPDQTFIIDEGLNVGGFVGNVVWQDDGPYPIWWTFESGNEDLRLLFQGGGSTIIIGKPEVFDFETQSTHHFVLKVWDAEGLTTYANYTIQLRDVTIPQVSYKYFSTPENRSNGTVLTTLQLNSIPDAGQSVVFSIDEDPTGGAFAIDPVTGVVTVANSQLLNFESNQQFQFLKIRTTDATNPNLTTVGNVGFNITNLNDAPGLPEQTFSVNENAANDAIVGQLVASDEDAGQILTYSITSSTLPGAFAIHASTGLIRVLDSSLLNFEQGRTVTLSVSVQDNGSPGLTTTRDIVIALTDMNEAPVIADQSFTVAENTLSTNRVGFATGSDVDAGQSLTYSITSSSLPGAFAIDAATGEVTVADGSLLDFEAITSATLIITATDNGNPALSASATVTVAITDVNERPIIIDQNFTVAENAADGTVVGTVIAGDVDAGQSLTYSITHSAPVIGAFAINAVTGQLTVANGSLLNFEGLSAVAVTVTVTDNGNPQLSHSATVLVTLTDVNEAPVVADQSFTVAENTLSTNRVGFVTGSDVDAGQSLTYAITSSSLPGAFAIDAATGEVTVADGSLLDFEAVTSATLVITATDNGNPALSSSATVTVAITDANERPIIVDQNFIVAENAVSGTVVGTVVSSDVDAGQTRTYAITASAPISGAFAINATTGEITVVDGSLLNFEAISAVALTVTVTDSANPALSSSAVVVVTLTDVNEAPVIANQSFSVAENSASGTIVGSIIASDVDGGQSLAYSITGSTLAGAFAIDAVTGQVTVANSALLNFEAVASVTLTVTVTDNGNPALSSSALVTISLTDVNEVPTITNQSFSVAENSASGTIVGNVTASDVDAGQSLTYSIVSGNTGGAFAINAATGRITVANAGVLDFETTPSFTLSVRVTDNGNPALSSTATVTINLTDVIEAIVVGLDVVPGDATNTIKLSGKFDVAILSTATFDARTVNVSTIRFGKNGTEDSISRDKRGNRIFSYRDVNGDGRLDLVVNITNSLTGLGLNDTLAKLSGLTNSGLQVLGSSAVRVRR